MRSRYLLLLLLLLLLRSFVRSFCLLLLQLFPIDSKNVLSLDTLNTNTLNIKNEKRKKNVEKKRVLSRLQKKKKKKKKKTKHRTHLSYYTFATRDIIIMVRSSFALFLSRAVLPRRRRRFLAAAFQKRGERERERERASNDDWHFWTESQRPFSRFPSLESSSSSVCDVFFGVSFR